MRPCVSTGAGTCALAVGICEVKCPLVLAKMFPDWVLSGSLLVNACLHLCKQIILPAIVCLAAYRIGLCHSRSGESRELAMVG